jgi:phage minor structural protein
MIYLQEGNFPLNEAFSSEIVQEANSTYQLTFKFPTSDPKWALLIPETELVADDLHGEQYFTIFEVEKQHGYVTVYANQVATLLNGYSINKINVDRVNGATVMNALVAGFKRETPFTFFSDVMSKHTLNLKDVSAMEALAKDKHSIVGQWGGDLVRDKYSVRLLEHGGIENESLFTYKKNMKSFQESKSTKELRTRIHFKKVIEAHEEGKKDQILTVTIDSPLINKYKHIYEADMEVQDQDVVDQKTLEEYGKRYFRETLCDMIEESLEIDVVGQADQPAHMFDIVSILHEDYDVDLRKKITKYKFNPMSIKLVSIGFGEVARSLADSISGMVNDSVDKKMKSYDAEYEAKVQKLVDNANAEYDKQAKELEHKITDGIEQAKAQAEVVKQEISAQVTDKINAANQANKNEIVEEFKAQYNGIEVKMQGLKATTDQLKTSDADIQKLINDFKGQTQSQFAGIQGAQSRFEQTTEKAISDLTNVANGKADRSYVEQTVAGVKEEFTTIGVGGGPNLLRNSRADEDLKYWTEPNERMSFTAHHYYFNGQKRMFLLSSGASVHSPRFIIKQNTNYMLNLTAFDANTERVKITFCKRRKGSINDFDEKQVIFDKTGSPAFNLDRAVKKSFSFDTGAFDEGYLLFEYQGRPNVWSGMFMTELDFYEGSNDRLWQPSPEDQNYLAEQAQATFERTVEGLSTQLTKLETKTGPNGELEQRMQTYSEKAAVDAVKATRQILGQGYIAKSKYDEDVAGITRRLEDLKQNNDQVISSKIAEYKQTVDGQFTTITNQMGDMLRKTDIQITSGQISFGTGKTINGRTISSLLVQEPESIALIAQLIKVKGDMVVDGSITSRHLASQSVRTGHMESGSVTTQILASNAVTADKLLVDSALIQKLLANQAFIRELISQKAFITELNSIKIAAERIQGGRLLSNNGATDFNLDNGSVNFYSNQGSIRRIDDTTSSQFIRLEQGYFRAERLIDQKAARIVIGTNHDKTEGVENATFAGTRLWSGSGNGDKESFHETVADRIIFYANGKYRSPWMIHNNTRDGYTYFMPLNENRVKHVIGRSDKRLHDIHTNEITLNGVRLKMMLKDIMLKIGYRGNNNWADLIN